MNMISTDATWLFDLGNSRLKAAWLRTGQIAQPIALDWEAPGFDNAVHAQLATWPAPARVLIASVTSTERAARLRGALQAWPDTDMQWLHSPRQACGIRNRYHVPKRLGIDRFLAMAAARAAADGTPVVVAGCGTALTLDAVDGDGLQRDGLITPSPQLMMQSLRGATAIGESNPRAFDDDGHDDTARALRSGCWRAATALVESYEARIQEECGAISLWLHGGWAESLKVLLEQTAGRGRMQILDDAVLRGLVIWAAQSGQIAS